MIRKIICGCTLLTVGSGAVAQGAFDFDDIPGIDQPAAIRIDINPVMMRFVEGAIRGSDPAGADMLKGLRSLKLRVYHTSAEENERQQTENIRRINGFIDNVTEELEDSGWQAVVAAEDEGSKVSMFMQMTEEAISGLTVMASDGAEAIFINIDGTISADDLGRIMSLLPVQDVLGSFPMPPVPGSPPRPTSD